VTLRWTARIVLVLWASVLLGGCGRNDAPTGQESPAPQPSQGPVLTHEQYQQAIIAILNSDDMRSASRLFTDTVATEHGLAQCTEKVRSFHGHLRSIVSEVEQLRPPADAVEGQRDFLAGAAESVRLVGVAADDVDTGTLTCGRELNKRIYGLASTERAEAALSKLEKSGYFFGGE